MRRAPRAVLGDRLPRSARSGRGTLDSGGSRERHYAARQCRASPRKCEARPWSIVCGVDRLQRRAHGERCRGDRTFEATGGEDRTPRVRDPPGGRAAPGVPALLRRDDAGDRASSRSDDPPHLGLPAARPRARRLEGLAPGGARRCGASGICSRFSCPPSSSQSFSWRLLSIEWLPRFSLPRSSSP